MVEDRVRRVSVVFRELGVPRILGIEEAVDEQFRAIKEFALRIGDPGWASLYCFLTGLVTYRLAMRGEDWWWCFSRLMPRVAGGSPPRGVEEAVGHVKTFLDLCRGALYQREQKKKRLERALRSRRALEMIVYDTEEALFRSARLVLGSVSNALNQDPSSKTLVFALKMAYYAFRGSTGVRRPLPMDVPIPIDTRVSCVSYSSGMIEAPGGDPVRVILSSPDVARGAWGLVSSSSSVPPLHIDSVVWVVGGFLGSRDVDHARRMVESKLSRAVEPRLSSLVSRELILRACRRR